MNSNDYPILKHISRTLLQIGNQVMGLRQGSVYTLLPHWVYKSGIYTSSWHGAYFFLSWNTLPLHIGILPTQHLSPDIYCFCLSLLNSLSSKPPQCFTSSLLQDTCFPYSITIICAFISFTEENSDSFMSVPIPTSDPEQLLHKHLWNT